MGYGLGGVGVVALGFATYYGVTALSRKNDEANYPAGSPARLTVYDQAREAQTAELVVGGIGIALLAAGVYLVLTSHGPSAPPPASASRLRLVPSFAAGPSGGELVIAGVF